MSEDLTIIMCPPLKDHPEPPGEQPGCKLFACPKCSNKMWLSKKKRGLLLFASLTNKDIFLGCYDCVRKKSIELRNLGAEFLHIDL